MAAGIKADAGLLFLTALGLLVLPLNWFAGAVAAAVFHELCHMGTIFAVGGKILGVRIGGTGASIEVSAMSPGKETVCALAGPAGSFLLAMHHRVIPVIGVCGLVQGAYNLLPVYPLDGGRVMNCLLQCCFEEQRAVCIGKTVEILLGIFLLAGSVWASLVWKLGMLPLFCSLMILFKNYSRKNTLQTEAGQSTIAVPFIMR